MSNKLLPCPFCGQQPALALVNGDLPQMICLEPDCPTNGVVITVEQWNTRMPYLCPDCHGKDSPTWKRMQLAEKVCEVLAEFRRNGEFFDPDTNKYLDAWMEATPFDTGKEEER